MEELSVLYVAGERGPEPPSTLTDRADVTVVRVETAADALERVESSLPDCVVSTHHLPDDTGTSLAAALRSVAPGLAIVLYADVDRDLLARDADTPVVEFVDAAAAAAEHRLAQLVVVAATGRCHTAYPLPERERERLDALPEPRGGDADRDAALDRLAELAALHFESVYAAINVVDDHSVTALGRYGDVVDTIPREASACTYTILGDGPTVIEDFGTDPRFEGIATAESSDIAFYAGVPVYDDRGLPIGTVCVYDPEPGTATQTDERFLSVLSAAASDWLTRDVARPDEPVATAEEGSE